VWARNGNYFESYFLEFILLPIRIMAVYIMIYFVIPRYLEREKYLGFVIAYASLILVSGFVQNIFTFFYKDFLGSQQESIIAVDAIFRNVILVNSTVVVIASYKIFVMWVKERRENRALKGEQKVQLLEIKADKRTYRIHPSDIYYVEGLGNYVTYYLKDKKLISHGSLGDTETSLPPNFLRIHKSYIINKDHIASYNNDDVEIGGTNLPIGRAFKNNVF
jgi:DNA-binding LytR/AlgR family response regulator